MKKAGWAINITYYGSERILSAGQIVKKAYPANYSSFAF